MQLAGKTALVTGGGTGIGAAIAVALAREGCRVVVTGRREEPLRATAAAFEGTPPIAVRAADVVDRDSVGRLVGWMQGEFGRIDILVNSAGINIPKRSMLDMPPEEWDRVLRINATGPYNCMHAVLPGMRERRDGLIVNISSVSGIRAGTVGGVAYSASKFALAALGLSVGNEESARGIRVTNVYPGEVDTPILEQRPTPVTPEHRARILQPEDVAAAVVMVASLPPRARVPELMIVPAAQPFS
ncbi:MAG: SDR family oxidoreductase [Planctomycetales bacterium]